MKVRFSVFVLTLFGSLTCWADELSADEQAVWDLENAYWEYVKSNDITGYRTLWDENFVGWPGFSRMALEKDVIHTWIPRLHANPAEKYDYTLTLNAVRSFGDVVVAHYLVKTTYSAADTGAKIRDGGTSRITHTWQRRGESWQIITGMSGTLISEENAR